MKIILYCLGYVSDSKMCTDRDYLVLFAIVDTYLLNRTLVVYMDLFQYLAVPVIINRLSMVPDRGRREHNILYFSFIVLIEIFDIHVIACVNNFIYVHLVPITYACI